MKKYVAQQRVYVTKKERVAEVVCQKQTVSFIHCLEFRILVRQGNIFKNIGISCTIIVGYSDF